jgi:hypothetical protein
MTTPTNKQLREFTLEYFSDPELDTFCFDYFPAVKNNFTTGMSKNAKV